MTIAEEGLITITKPIIKQIEELVADVPGWSPIDQLYFLFLLAFAYPRRLTNIVELGTWCGRSALVLALAAKLRGEGIVHAVDLYPAKDDWYQNSDSSYSFKAEYDGKATSAYTDQRVWQEPYDRDIRPVYERFPGTWEAVHHFIENSNFTQVVKPFRGTLTEFVSANNGIKAQLVFLDGDHGSNAVCEDINNAHKILEPGGWLAFDDAFSYYDGVDQMIRELVIGSDRFTKAQQITRKCFIAQRV